MGRRLTDFISYDKFRDMDPVLQVQVQNLLLQFDKLDFEFQQAMRESAENERKEGSIGYAFFGGHTAFTYKTNNITDRKYGLESMIRTIVSNERTRIRKLKTAQKENQ